MKSRALFLLVILVGAILPTTAQDSPRGAPPAPPPGGPPSDLPPEILASRPSAPPPLPDPTELYEQLALLHEFLDLSDEELRRVRETVGVIERMTPAERTAMQARLAAMRHEASQLEAELSTFAGFTPEARHSDLRRLWLSFRPGDRIAWKKAFETLAPAQRAPWVIAQLDAFQAREEALIEQLRGAAARR